MKKLISILILLILAGSCFADSNLVALYQMDENSTDTNTIADSQATITGLTAATWKFIPADPNKHFTLTLKTLGEAGNDYTCVASIGAVATPVPKIYIDGFNIIIYVKTGVPARYDANQIKTAWDACEAAVAIGDCNVLNPNSTAHIVGQAISNFTGGTSSYSSQGIFHGDYSFTANHSVDGKIDGALKFNSPSAYYLINAGTLLEDFESNSVWTITGGVGETDPCYKTGEYSLKLTSNSGATCTAQKTVNITVGSYNTGFWFYVEDVAKIYGISITLTSSTGKYFIRYISSEGAGNENLNNGWNFKSFNTSEWTAVGGIVWTDPITKFDVAVYPHSEESGVVYFDSFYYRITTRPKCIITFDDGRDTVFTTAYPIMETYGFKGTCYIVSSAINDAGYMTDANLTTLYNDGWDISNHTYSHTNLATLSEANQAAEVNNCAAYLLTNGFTRNNMHRNLAYPYGAHDANTILACISEDVLTARTVAAGYNFRVNQIIDPWLWKCQNEASSTTLLAVKSQIDSAIESGQEVMLLFHNIVDSPVDATDWPTADFNSLMTYLDSKRGQIDVVTQSDWYANFAEVPTTRDYIDTGQTFESTFQDSFSISKWIKPDDGQPASAIQMFTGINTGNGLIYLKINTNGSIQFDYEQVDPYQTNAISGVVFANGQETWHHIVGTIEKIGTSAQAKIYLDGVLVGDSGIVADVDMASWDESGHIFVGAFNNDGGIGAPFSGSLDDIRIYNKALSPVQIRRLWRQGCAGQSLDWLPVRDTEMITIGAD
jgi:peptidoglycan/xylan/chitin deacetylase (PgdA/CDA1 family)